MARIVRLEAQAFKRLRAVEIRPDGAVVTLRGANGAGKSSVLDAIAAAIGGERLCPEVPIHRGSTRARVEVELDDGLVAVRTWNGKGSTLEVRRKDGEPVKKPQSVLDALVGKLTFDPLAFLRLEPAKQAETLRALVGVNFTLLDTRRHNAYTARTDANRAVESLRARLAAAPAVDAPDEPVSAAELLAEQQRRTAQINENNLKRAELQRLRLDRDRAAQRVKDAEGAVEYAEEQLRRAKAQLEADRTALAQIAERGKPLRDEVAALQDPDVQEVLEQLRNIEATNERVRQKKARAALVADLATAEKKAEQLTAAIEEVDQAKRDALAAASFPVPELGFGEDGVTLNGLPLSQASSAEQLRVSVAMGLALNPKLKVMLVRDASLLDERSVAMVADMAEKADAQIWLEVVGAGGSGILIEDGAVAGADVVKTECPGEGSEAVHG